MVQTTDPLWREPSVRLAEESEAGSAAAFGGLRLLLFMVVLLVGFRCWIAVNMDFESDETYYWLWSRHLALSFYDHPPMVAYFIRLGTLLFGNTALGLRCVAIAAMLLASGLLYLLAFALFEDRRIGLLSLLWFYVMPHTAFFSVVIFPDTPAIFFWIISCYALAQVWRSGRGEWWYLAGLGLGLTLLSKYTGLFLFLGAGAWLLLSPDMRHWLRRREPYLAILIALALFSPVILWNAQRDWASFAKQFGRVLDVVPGAGLVNAAAYVGVQASFVSPLIFIFAVAGMWIALWRGLARRQAQWLLLAMTSGPTLVFFLIHALSDKVLAQWPSAAYPTALVAGVAAFAGRAEDARESPWLRRAFVAAPWVGVAMTLVMYVQMTLAPAPIAAIDDPLNRFSGWAGLAEATGETAAAQHVGYIATSEYATNSILAFYLPHGPVIFQATEAMRYTNLPPVDQELLTKTTGLYLAAENDDHVQEFRRHYDAVVLISTIQRARRGDPFETFRIYRLSGYHGGLPF